jgi:ubiquitin carboxyl-terminal hydrolase 7
VCLVQQAKNEILLFFKYYDPVKESLRYVGRTYFSRASKVGELWGMLCTLAGLPEGTELEVVEEVKFEPTVLVEGLAKNHSFSNRVRTFPEAAVPQLLR